MKWENEHDCVESPSPSRTTARSLNFLLNMIHTSRLSRPTPDHPPAPPRLGFLCTDIRLSSLLVEEGGRWAAGGGLLSLARYRLPPGQHRVPRPAQKITCLHSALGDDVLRSAGFSLRCLLHFDE